MLIRQLDITGKKLTKREYKELIPRANLSVESAMIKIARILQRVKAGDEAELIKLATEFDGITPKEIAISRDELKNALSTVALAVALLAKSVAAASPAAGSSE